MAEPLPKPWVFPKPWIPPWYPDQREGHNPWVPINQRGDTAFSVWVDTLPPGELPRLIREWREKGGTLD